MKQLDVPYVALNVVGQPALATLHAMLARDAFTNETYRTNRELGTALGVGDKRVKQYLDELGRYGLATVEQSGSRRVILLDWVPNGALLSDIFKTYTSASMDPLSDEIDPVDTQIGQVTKWLLEAFERLPVVQYPSPASSVSLGYVKSCASGTELAFYCTKNSTTYYKIKNTDTDRYESVAIPHASLPGALGLASLAVIPKKKTKPRTTDQIPAKSFAYRFWSKDKLELDVVYYDKVRRILTIWNAAFGTSVPLVGETYRLIRQMLCENGLTEEQLDQAVRNFGADPFWKPKRPGLATFFDKPARVFEYLEKSAQHDRFARHMTVPALDVSLEADEDGNIRF